MAVIFTSGLAILLLIGLFIFIKVNSQGKPPAFLDKNGAVLANSISEKVFVEVNGKKFGMIIKGQNLNNPVLLYLHGGMPDYFLTQKYPTGLDSIFTVIWWDQRGAGLSYDGIHDKNVSINALIQDAREITNYARDRFSQQKIYLMAHSGGTFLGVKLIEAYPELYAAYIGVAQISFQKLSEVKAYEYILEHYKNDKSKKKIVEKLANHPVRINAPLPIEYIRLRDYAMHDLGIGTMRQMQNVISGIFIPSLLFKEYTLIEKINLWKGKAKSGISIMWYDMMTHDLSNESTEFKIPVYFLHGIFDYTCSYKLAQAYFTKINAPSKEFFSLQQSAHSPIFEEPNECIKIIQQNILK